MTIRAAVVVGDDALYRRNRIREKLEQRGLDVQKEWSANGTVPASTGVLGDLGALIVYGTIRPGHLAAWKNLADHAAARFFRVPHQASREEWRHLEDWVATTIVATKEPTGSVDYWKKRAEADRASATAAEAAGLKMKAEILEWEAMCRRLEADLETARKKLAEPRPPAPDPQVDAVREELRTSRAEVSDLRKKVEALTLARDTLADNNNRLGRTLREAQEGFAHLSEQTVGMRERNQALALRAERAEVALEAATKKEAGNAPPPPLPFWLQRLGQDAATLDAAVTAGLMQGPEALRVLLAKHTKEGGGG